MRPVDKLLDRLDKVRKSGAGWTARCPAHDDRTASLSLAETDDGRALVHCFACCPMPDVLAALGLTSSDLFPERIKSKMTREERNAVRERMRAANMAAAINVLDRESTVVVIAAQDVLEGRALSPEDCGRLQQAAQIIRDARAVIHGR